VERRWASCVELADALHALLRLAHHVGRDRGVEGQQQEAGVDEVAQVARADASIIGM
jgi:hypothetical protein